MDPLVTKGNVVSQTDYFVKASPDNTTVEIYDLQEIDDDMKERVCMPYFIKLFDDLSNKEVSIGKRGITRPVFIEFVNLPGLIGERFFNIFDKRKANLISLNDFTVNMLSLFSKDFNVRIKMVFNMFDFDNDGVISKEDVKALLIHIPPKNFCQKIAVEGKYTQKPESYLEADIKQDTKELDNLCNSFFKKKDKVDFKTFVEICEIESSDLFFAVYSLLKEKCPGIKQFKNFEAILFKDNPDQMKKPAVLKSPSIKILASPKCPSRFSPLSQMVMNQGTVSPTKEQKKAVQFLSQFGPLKDTKKSKIDNYKKSSTENITLNGTRMSNKIISDTQVTMSPSLMLKGENRDRLYCKCGREIIDLNLMLCNECIIREKEGKIEGLFYKIKKNGDVVQKKYLLEGKELYCYDQNNQLKPKNVHPFYECYYDDLPLKESNNEKIFLFQVKWKNKLKVLGSSDKNLFEKFSSAIKKAVGYANIADYYEFVKDLGQGKFGIVKLAIHRKSGKKVAVKLMNKTTMNELEKELMMREIENLKLCHHKNIVKLYDIFENAKMVYIVMEFLEGGDLFSYLEKRNFRITESRAKKIICSLISAINYLNSFGIVHRDLKPENILLVTTADDSDIKLSDFGLAKAIGPNETCNEPFGTITYVAPEILMRKQYGKGVDIWSLGMIGYLMLGGYLAFDDYNDSEVVKKTCTQELSFKNIRWETVSEEAKDFIRRCLTKDMNKRATLNELITHKWVSTVEPFTKEFKDVITEHIKSVAMSDYKTEFLKTQDV